MPKIRRTHDQGTTFTNIFDWPGKASFSSIKAPKESLLNQESFPTYERPVKNKCFKD